MSNPVSSRATLPTDKRFRLGGFLFLVSLVVFFLCSILFYGLYAYARRNDPQPLSLPGSFLYSTLCLLVISVLVHLATRCVRRERRLATTKLLCASAVAAVVFTAIQFLAMGGMISAESMPQGASRGVAGMVVVLAFLHALHVIGGVIALVIVAAGSYLGRYDHERHWPVDFAAQYWHFLDVVWLCMLAAFWFTTDGF